MSQSLKFHPIFLYYQKVFEIQILDNRKKIKYLRMTFDTQQSPAYIKYHPSRALEVQMCVRFSLRPAVFKIQGC